METNKILSQDEKDELIKTLQIRFEKNMNRHLDIDWKAVESKLENGPKKLSSLQTMELTGGDPDVIGFVNSGANIFFAIAQLKVQKDGEVLVTIEKH